MTCRDKNKSEGNHLACKGLQHTNKNVKKFGSGTYRIKKLKRVIYRLLVLAHVPTKPYVTTYKTILPSLSTVSKKLCVRSTKPTYKSKSS